VLEISRETITFLSSKYGSLDINLDSIPTINKYFIVERRISIAPLVSLMSS